MSVKHHLAQRGAAAGEQQSRAALWVLLRWARVRSVPRASLIVVLCGMSVFSACRKADRSEDLRFPSPARPVASIVSPEFLDEKTRDAGREAEQVMDRLAIAPGVRVADIGAGHGYYTVRLARRLGPSAKIYAEDIKPAYLKDLEARLKREGIGTEVTLVLGREADPKLPPNSVDVAILAYVYHEIANPFELLYRLRAALAPHARVGIVDTTRPTQEHGTPPPLLRCETEAVGYRQIDFLWLVPSERYLAVLAPPDKLPRPEAITPCSP